MDLLPFTETLQLAAHWVDNPPANEVLQKLAMAITGWHPRFAEDSPQPDREPMTPAQIAEQVRLAGQQVDSIDKLPAHLRACLDNAISNVVN